MRGVVQGNTVSCTNPTIFFTYQSEGLLADVFSLTMEIRDIIGTTPVTKTGPTALNLAACPTGVRLGLGRFAASFDTSTWRVGTHEVIWTYVVASGDATLTARQRFEVLDSNTFVDDGEFVTYASTKYLKGQGFTQADGALQELADTASRRIEELTARFFEPRFLSLRLNSRGSRALTPGDPIIGIESVTIESTSVGGVLSTTTIDPGLFKIFNRHTTGLINPDDRDNPRIELFDAIPRKDRPAVSLGFKFFPGPLIARVIGVYGYTDPNGSPFGQEPKALRKVVAAFIAEEALSPVGGGGTLGGTGSSTGVIKRAKTRDQEIEYVVPTGAAAIVAVGPITGNRQVDDVLLRFMRPPHFGVA